MKPGSLLLAAALAALVSPLSGVAQDVELLGQEYGTRPPDAYYRMLEEDPSAFRFSRAWKNRMGAPLLVDAEGAGAAGPQGTPLGERPGGVTGNLAFPLFLGLYSDSPETPPFTSDQIQKQFFDGPNPTGTIPEYFAEQSGGSLNLTGVTQAWHRTSLTGIQVSGGVGGLDATGTVGAFIVELLVAIDDGTYDFGQFDNDGPDGVPNSGDDDGYVDVLAVMHPTNGAECNRNLDLVWSHRWSLRFAFGQEYATHVSSANGGPIRVDDYTIQPAMSCEGGAINEIGVFAHELGHGLGLPDLYNTSAGAQNGAIGRWGLMGHGAWGCRGGNPGRPCHLGAWSKSVLGWVEVETLAPDADHGTLTLPPVEASRKVYRIDLGDESSEFFLLETRSQTGFDQEIYAPGLLVWHIDQDFLDARWGSNSINTNPQHMGVWVRAADGLNQAALPINHRGDAGDIFPGFTGNTSFHAGSNPASFSHDGVSAGVTLLDIAMQGDDVTFRVLTRYQTLLVSAGGTGGNPAMISVDGGAPTPTDAQVTSAPFQTHTIEAAGGGLVAPGVRTGFLAWEDGSDRIREFTTQLSDSTLIATYGGDIEVLLDVSLRGPAEGIAPGQLDASPPSVDGWYDEGQAVTLTALPRTGFSFREWTGDLAGASNPTTVVMDVPLAAIAEYDIVFGLGGNPAQATVEAAVVSEVLLVADNANLPVSWELLDGGLPHGMAFIAAGAVRGIAVESGVFPLTLKARDAIGLEATAPMMLAVSPPSIGTTALTAPFFEQGVGPNEPQLDYLDRQGNANGRYDLGDFRAFILANPNVAAAAMPSAAPVSTTVVVPLTFGNGGER